MLRNTSVLAISLMLSLPATGQEKPAADSADKQKEPVKEVKFELTKAQKKQLEVTAETMTLIANIGATADSATLRKNEGRISKNWKNLVEVLGEKDVMAPVFSLMRARAITAKKDKGRIVPAWDKAIDLLHPRHNDAQMMNFYTEAGDAASAVKDATSARKYYAAARALAYTSGAEADRVWLQLKSREIALNAGEMEWRPLNEALVDMREFAQRFPMWSLPQLDALITECTVRLFFQPARTETEYEAKRDHLSELKEEIIMVRKAIDKGLPDNFKRRYRDLMYQLEDFVNL